MHSEKYGIHTSANPQEINRRNSNQRIARDVPMVRNEMKTKQRKREDVEGRAAAAAVDGGRFCSFARSLDWSVASFGVKVENAHTHTHAQIKAEEITKGWLSRK